MISRILFTAMLAIFMASTSRAETFDVENYCRNNLADGFAARAKSYREAMSYTPESMEEVAVALTFRSSWDAFQLPDTAARIRAMRNSLSDHFDYGIFPAAENDYVAFSVESSKDPAVIHENVLVQTEYLLTKRPSIESPYPGNECPWVPYEADWKGRTCAERKPKRMNVDFLEGRPLPTGASSYDGLLEHARSAGSVLCGYFDPIRAIRCGDILGKIYQFMRPLDGGPNGKIAIAAIPILDSFLNRKNITVPLANAAVKGLRKMKLLMGGRSGALHDYGGLYGDIYSSFREANFSESESADLTWETLGVISTRGPNTAFLAPYYRKDQYYLFLAVEVLSKIPLVIDSFLAKSGKSYSLPYFFTTRCNYGKSYHFWMAAYLARKHRAEGVRAAADAGYLSDVTYQMVSMTDGRDPVRPFREVWDSSTSNKMRIDLAFAAAGAWFGAAAGTIQKNSIAIDIDRAIERIHFAAEHLRPIVLKEGTTLQTDPLLARRWFKLFSPATPMRVIREQIESAAR